MSRPLASLVALVAVLAFGPPAPAHAEPSQWAAEWPRTDFTRTTIGWSEVLSGGPPRDGIPSIDAPEFIPVAAVSDLEPQEPVIGLEIGNEARAYPLRILIWHEIVNDTVDGRPVAVTYCPLCNSAAVFARRVDGQVLDFGTTGKLRNSDLIMYDRQTESWWQQFTGEAMVGAMMGRELERVPSRLESFADFKARHPDGKVLATPRDTRRAYGANPYVGYDSSAVPFLFRGELPKDVAALARVVVARPADGPAVIVTLEHVRKRGPLTLGGVRLAWKPGQASALDTPEIARGRDVGTVEALAATAGGGTGALVPYEVTFAFVAHAFHPEIGIVKE